MASGALCAGSVELSTLEGQTVMLPEGSSHTITTAELKSFARMVQSYYTNGETTPLLDAADLEKEDQPSHVRAIAKAIREQQTADVFNNST